METIKGQIPKQEDHAFKKNVYLLGTDKEGIKYWLEAPTWDCDWYWGFGYVETYQNNKKPSMARDIDSHSHIDSSFLGKVENKYIHNLYDTPILTATTFTEAEGWTLGELFKTFYHLQKSAELFGRGGMGTTTNPVAKLLTNKKQAKRINEVLIPEITKQIINILTPKD